jgi:hypothetical protein
VQNAAKIAAASTGLLLLALGLAGCGSSSNGSASPPTTTSNAAPAAQKPHRHTSALPAARKGCLPVSTQLVARIRRNIVLDGAKLANVRAVASSLDPGLYYVSARVSGGGAPRRAVATWATQSLAGRKPIYALDAFAALVSQFGGGVSANPDYVVSAPGAYRSRVCAGGKGVSKGQTAPASGPIIHSPG